jgi:hypothetical protein
VTPTAPGETDRAYVVAVAEMCAPVAVYATVGEDRVEPDAMKAVTTPADTVGPYRVAVDVMTVVVIPWSVTTEGE